MKKRWYTNGDESIAYDTAYEIAAFLYRRQHLIQDYRLTAYGLAETCAAWGDWKGMRESLNFLVDVMEAIKQRNKTGDIPF